MTASVFIRKVFDKLYNRLWVKSKRYSLRSCKYIKKNIAQKNIWLLGIPKSRNLGDQAQVICSCNWFSENYSDYKIFAFDSRQLLSNNCILIDYIAKNIKPDDFVFFQSGYNFTDMYPYEEQMHRETVKRIQNNRIVFLPQTISFKKPYKSNSFVQESLSLYQNNKNVYIMCRDNLSFQIAKDALPNVLLYPFPDVVTMFIGRYRFTKSDKSGIILCVRNDEEGIFSKAEINNLKTSLETIDTVKLIDTTIDSPSQFFIRRNRKKYVFKMIDMIHSHKVVITDRYHGLIFSVVSNTPVVLLKTIDHKITEGIKWFPPEILSHIRFAETMDEAVSFAKELYENHDFCTSDYFYSNYFSSLKSIIENADLWKNN